MEPRTGIAHDFCGRQHAIKANALSRDTAPHGSCATCQLPGCDETVAFDSNSSRVHDYCCRSHAQQHSNPKFQRNKKRAAPGARSCELPGCAKEVWFDGHTTHDYCGRDHAMKARDRQLVPPPIEMQGLVERTFEGPGGCWSASLLTNQHPKLAGVKQQFLRAWNHQNLTRPSVARVYQIRNPPEVYQAYQNYKASVGDAEERRFHGESALTLLISQ